MKNKNRSYEDVDVVVVKEFFMNLKNCKKKLVI